MVAQQLGPPDPLDIELPLDQVAQILICLLSYGTAIYFFFQRRNGKCSWHNLYVMFVQGTCYFFFVAVPLRSKLLAITETLDHGAQPGNDETQPDNDEAHLSSDVVVIRYLSWIIVSPVVLVMICEVVHDGDPGSDTVMRMVLSMLFSISFHIIGSIYTMPAIKCTAFTLSCLATIYIFWGVCGLYQKTAREANNPTTRSLLRWRKKLLIYFIVSSLIYPVLWLLDCGQTDVLDPNWSEFWHTIGDFFSKNIFSILVYLFYGNVLNASDESSNHRLSRRRVDARISVRTRNRTSDHNADMPIIEMNHMSEGEAEDSYSTQVLPL